MENTFCCSFTEIKQLLIYPPGKGGLPINTEDYLCLAQDQFLNDVIIDFYLKHLLLTLPKEQQDKVHVFSTFFYKRLTTKPVKTSRYVCVEHLSLFLRLHCFNRISYISLLNKAILHQILDIF